MLSAIDRNHCPQSIGIPVRNRRNPHTAGVDALPPQEKAAVLSKVRTFTDFNGDNDPHGEHDMVFVEVQGERYFAKCDYYDLNLEYGSEDPSDPTKTTRVLTIGHMSDY
jgi:hypothetical protein